MMRWLVALALCAGCRHAPPWRPVPDSEDVLLIDTQTIARVEPDGRILLLSHARHDDAIGVGTARLPAMPLADAARSEHSRLSRGRAYYALALRLVDLQPRAAYDAAIAGIKVLEIYYLRRGQEDHSQRRLEDAVRMLQTTPPQEGAAARLAIRVLQRRLFRYPAAWRSWGRLRAE